MELKHDKVTIILYELALLIVPYGIEWHSYMCRQVIWGFYCMELKLVKLSCYFIYYDYLIM